MNNKIKIKLIHFILMFFKLRTNLLFYILWETLAKVVKNLPIIKNHLNNNLKNKMIKS